MLLTMDINHIPHYFSPLRGGFVGSEAFEVRSGNPNPLSVNEFLSYLSYQKYRNSRTGQQPLLRPVNIVSEVEQPKVRPSKFQDSLQVAFDYFGRYTQRALASIGF